MKLDKEFARKNRFWLLLAAAYPMALIGLVILFFVVPSYSANTKKKIDANWKTIQENKKKPNLKNQKWVEQAAAKAKVKKEQETKVWEAAWKGQDRIMTWPEEFESEFHYADGDFAMEIVLHPSGTKPPAADKERLQFSGKLTKFSKDWIEVENGNDKMRFQRSTRVKVSLSDDTKKIVFAEIPDNLAKYTGATVTYQKGKFFADPLTDSEEIVYERTYSAQILDILKDIGPVNEVGEPVVQFKDWVWKKGTRPPAESKFFQHVDKWDWQNNDAFSEEAWIAQENLWVQRELFRLIKKANDHVAQFEPKFDIAKDKGLKEYPFENHYWKLTLSVKGPKTLHVKLQNKLDRRQRLDVRFLVKLQKDGDYKLLPSIGGEPVPAQGTRDQTTKKELDVFEQDLELKEGNIQGFFGVRQVLTWETAAVRRLDQVSIGMSNGREYSAAHRASHKPLLAHQKKASSGDDGENKARGGETWGKNKLVKNRYIDVTPQFRRLPIGLVLIVDQEHLAKVQTAFADSQLRFLTSQVLINRFPGSVRPEPVKVADGGVGPGPGTVPPPPGRGLGFEKSFPGSFPYPRYGEPGGAVPSVGGGDEQESNLEVVLYGVMSFYERYPPKAAAN